MIEGMIREALVIEKSGDYSEEYDEHENDARTYLHDSREYQWTKRPAIPRSSSSAEGFKEALVNFKFQFPVER